MPWETVLIRLFLALLLGIVVGLERQFRQNTAGLRMNSLVSIGAASFVLFGESIIADSGHNPDSLARIAGQIVTGIGFLGGGVIMHEGASIKGIATAATLWCSAAIGMFAGAGFIASAIVCTGFIVATNLMLRPLAWSIKKRIDMPQFTLKHDYAYTLSVVCPSDKQDHIRVVLLQEIHNATLQLQKLESRNLDEPNTVETTVTVTCATNKDAVVQRIFSHLVLHPGVTTASWRAEPAV